MATEQSSPTTRSGGRLKGAGPFGSLAFVILLLIVWGTVPATRNPLTVVVVGATAAVGLELLRRQVQRDGVEDRGTDPLTV